MFVTSTAQATSHSTANLNKICKGSSHNRLKMTAVHSYIPRERFQPYLVSVFEKPLRCPLAHMVVMRIYIVPHFQLFQHLPTRWTRTTGQEKTQEQQKVITEDVHYRHTFVTEKQTSRIQRSTREDFQLHEANQKTILELSLSVSTCRNVSSVLH